MTTVISSLDAEDLGHVEEQPIQLQSVENELFAIPRAAAVASRSQFLAVAINTNSAVCPTKLRGVTLQRVVSFLEHHLHIPCKPIPKPLPSTEMSAFVSQFDADLVDLDHADVFELIAAANYLDLRDLLDLACAKIASLLKNKTPEQIRETFGIKSDFTPEEELAVRAENAWAEASSDDMESE